MLQEIIDLQNNAVAQLLNKTASKKEIAFRAPTGSGKTRMMADFMNRIIADNPNVVFVVSTLSKGNLAKQNYDVFKDCRDKNIFPDINPHLITTEIGEEESLFIPTDYNVYVLARDLYKKGGRLMQGCMNNFLETITSNLFGNGLNKTIYLIKDECHQATNNLDNLSNLYFTKIINISATPNLKRGQNPDVEISDSEAVNAKLIKRVELGDENDKVEDAIRKFEEIKKDYRNLLGVNPCLIIQISNKEKAELEWFEIEKILNKEEHQHLKWMSIVDKKEKCKTNDKVGKLPIDKWKEYAKENVSTIDIIIFKMVISEGWDIPRACMLYQVRDSKSTQLDEQVIGRVRRNPRLTDFEKLSVEAQNLALTAWVWGIMPKAFKKTYQVKLFGNANDIPSAVKIKTTRLKSLTERSDFDIDTFINNKPKIVGRTSIFKLYSKLQKCDNELKKICYDYAGDDVEKWLLFCEHLDSIQKEYNKFICDYSESMEVVKDDFGKEKEISFPLTSTYIDSMDNNDLRILDWVWRRKDGNKKFSFDSAAEKDWAEILMSIASDEFGTAEVGEPNPLYGHFRTDGNPEPKRLTDESKHLWGKNFLTNSEICYEYYLHGTHFSYPDFIMKDKKGRIHIFEVKSVNVSNTMHLDNEEYKEKVNALKECYRQCSKLLDYYFYLPLLKDNDWQITRFHKGEEDTLTEQRFLMELRK